MGTNEQAVQGVHEIPLKDIRPSKTNPRTRFEKTAQAELVASVKSHGILQPVLVRPLGAAKGGDYELVAGHRRFMAAREAGLSEIPAVVRELDDKQALEVQIIENLQRADLHPIEEAEGYRRLLDLHEYAVEDLAAKVGKSKGYVYARLKLCELTEKAKTAFWEGKLNPSVALLLARIPVPKLQAQALKEVSHGQYGDSDPMSYREAAEHIQERYMLRLDQAPFQTEDAGLVQKAGPCTMCPKRTGNQAELFPDIKRADVCTDPSCFAAKRDAAWIARKAAAEGSGTKVLSDSESKKVFSRYSDEGSLDGQAPYVKLSDRCYKDPKSRTYGTLLRNHVKDLVVLARDKAGGVHELLPKSAVPGLLKKAGHAFAAEDAKENLKAKQERERMRLAREQERAAEEAGLAAVVAASEKAPEKVFLEVMVFGLIAKDDWRDRPEEIAERRGLVEHEGLKRNPKRSREALREAARKMSLGELRGLVLELTVEPGVYRGDPLLDLAAKAYGVDLKAVGKKAIEARKNTASKAGTCQKCGCVEKKACPGGCSWANSEKTLCTRCAPAPAKKPAAAKAGAR